MTYGRRNTAAMQSSDAAAPLNAIKKNVGAYRKALVDKGYTDKDIDAAVEKLSRPFKKE